LATLFAPDLHVLIRFPEEIARLSSVFQGLIAKVPEMVPLLASLRRYCMNDSTFDETDFKEVLEVFWEPLLMTYQHADF
jgi:hypothetical protein